MTARKQRQIIVQPGGVKEPGKAFFLSRLAV
jgi:hypothetical protein